MNGDMMTFRPLFWPTFFTIPAIILLISLGSWQLSRLAEKTELIAQFEQRSNAAAIGINQVTEPVEEFEFMIKTKHSLWKSKPFLDQNMNNLCCLFEFMFLKI